MMRGRIVRIQLDGPFVFLLGSNPVPVIGAFRISQRNTCLGESIVNYQCPFRGCLDFGRSEEHTSELQSQSKLVCRLLLEKNKRILGITCRNSSSDRTILLLTSSIACNLSLSSCNLPTLL